MMSETISQNYYYPNKMGRIVLLAMEEILGHDGINSVLDLADLTGLISNYPPDNLDRQFRFEHIGKMHSALEDLYGSRSGRGLALRSGRSCLKHGLREFGSLIGMNDLTFRLLPLGEKVRVGTKLLADTFNYYSDQRVRLDETENQYHWFIDRCPMCWSRKSDAPVCHMAVGILQEALFWISGGKHFPVEEIACIAMGDPHCLIVIGKKPIE